MFKWEEFKNILNIELNDVQKHQLSLFYKLLNEENQKYNLTRITSASDVLYKHFIDSLIFIDDYKINSQKIIDIGSGAGFPGILLKILFPNITIKLLDSNSKKVNFLNMVIRELDLKNISAISGRAEEISRIENEEYDIAISRAVAQTDIMLEISVRFLKVNGDVLLLKGPKVISEIKNINKVLKELKLKQKEMLKYNNPNIGERYVLIFSKLDETPANYPREYSKILKSSTKNKN